MLRRTFIFLTGIMILGFGVAMVIASDLGATAWDTVFVGLNRHLGLTIGTCVFIVQSVLMFVNALLLHRRPEWLSVINILATSAAIDLWLELLFADVHLNNAAVQAVFLLAGLACISGGIALYLKSDFPKSQVDGLMLALHHRFRLSLQRSRTIVEGIAVILGLALGGPVGIGTLVAIVALGPLIQFFHKCLSSLDINPGAKSLAGQAQGQQG